MKKIISLLLLVLISGVAVSQNTKNNSYILEGDVIQATLYNQDGTLAQTGYYTKDNKLTGEWISYDFQGNKTAIATYKNGEKVGTWFFHRGVILQEVSFVDSRIANVTTRNINH
ncbi:nicotinic acid mononucleotide adenyltransferase [Aequorivita viscosa]|nr:nicotinic acid mononucleotide adenyltransferase [Aequorivita viscosa]